MLRERLVSHIREDFPGLAIRSARLVTSGWDHDVVVINEDYIFRFPDNEYVDLEREIAVLRALRGKTTLAIPRIEYVGKSTPYVGYPILRGEPLTSDRYASLSESSKATVADDLARFLIEVHAAISVEKAQSLGLPLDDHRSYIEEASTLRHRIDDPAIVQFIGETLDEASWRLDLPAPQTFLYNDLHGNNMAFDDAEGRLAGIFDFGDVAYGDVHRDISTLYYIDRRLFEATVAAYQRASGLTLSRRRMMVWYRLERLADLAEVFGQPSHPESGKIFKEMEGWMANPAIYANDP